MDYDIIVIGAGAAGLNIATPCAKLGLKTLLVDKTPRLVGGECLNTGCVPSKALLHVAKLKRDADRMAPFGITTSGAIDFQKVFGYVNDVQDSIREHETPEFLESLGVQFAYGNARFTSRDSVQVGGEVHRARRIVIATGSRPVVPPIPGVEQVSYLTHENLWQLKELPKEFLIVGAGPIGMEMSQAFTRLGSKVTVIERAHRLLLRDSAEAGELIGKHLSAEGVNFLLNAELLRFTSPNSAEIQTPEGTIEQRFDQVLIAAGKGLNHDSLDVEKAGIETANGRMKIDPYLRTTNKSIYACGDAAGQIYLTHVTELHGALLLWNFFSPLKKKLSYDDLSWVTFTDPEVATFGLSEKQLQERGVKYRRVVQGFEDVNRASTDAYPESKLTVYLKGDHILGGTMIAPSAGELIQELVLAKQNKIPLRKILEKTYAYPTASRINRWLAIWEYDRKTTDTIKKVLRGAYRLLN